MSALVSWKSEHLRHAELCKVSLSTVGIRRGEEEEVEVERESAQHFHPTNLVLLGLGDLFSEVPPLPGGERMEQGRQEHFTQCRFPCPVGTIQMAVKLSCGGDARRPDQATLGGAGG